MHETEAPHYKKIFSYCFMRIDNENLVTALKCSLSLGLSVFLGMLYSKDDAYWAGITAGLSFSPRREPTFKMANVRIQGTLIGSIYGVLVCFLAQRLLVLRFLALLPWVVVTNYLRHSEMYGHAGGITAFIAAAMILARKNRLPPAEFAIVRIIEVFIGLACSILAELVLKPRRASSLARAKVSTCLETLHVCTGPMVFAQANMPPLELKERVEKLRVHVLQLTKLTKEAKVEPNFWFLPFNSDIYTKLLGSMEKMVELLLFIYHALEYLLEDSKKFGASGKELQEFINGDVEIFKDVVVSSMKCLQEIVEIKSLAELANEFEKGGMSSDHLEAGGASSPRGPCLLTANEEEIEKLVGSFLQHAVKMVTNVNLVECENLVKCEEWKGHMVLCLSGLGFCIRSMMRETKVLEVGIQELLQWENPSSQINVIEISRMINSVSI